MENGRCNKSVATFLFLHQIVEGLSHGCLLVNDCNIFVYFVGGTFWHISCDTLKL